MIKLKILMSIILICLFPSLSTANENSPVGYWKTMDDVTGKPKAIIQLWQNTDKTLSGRILKVFPHPGQDQIAICKACPGERHNQPLVGLVFLKNLKQNQTVSNHWMNGEILDPKNGKIYHSTLNLTNNGQKVNVRGYIGLPLFGRSQTWIRVSGLETV